MLPLSGLMITDLGAEADRCQFRTNTGRHLRGQVRTLREIRCKYCHRIRIL